MKLGRSLVKAVEFGLGFGDKVSFSRVLLDDLDLRITGHGLMFTMTLRTVTNII